MILYPTSSFNSDSIFPCFFNNVGHGTFVYQFDLYVHKQIFVDFVVQIISSTYIFFPMPCIFHEYILFPGLMKIRRTHGYLFNMFKGQSFGIIPFDLAYFNIYSNFTSTSSLMYYVPLTKWYLIQNSYGKYPLFYPYTMLFLGKSVADFSNEKKYILVYIQETNFYRMTTLILEYIDPFFTTIFTCLCSRYVGYR